MARTAPRKISTIEDTGDLKPCHNSTRKFGCRLCHLTQIMYVHTFVGLLRRKRHTHCTKNTGLIHRFPDLFEIHYGMLQGSNQVLIFLLSNLTLSVHCIAQHQGVGHHPPRLHIYFDVKNTKTADIHCNLHSSSLTQLPKGSC